MIIALADHILSPLGDGTECNLDAVLRGESRLFLRAQAHGQALHDPFVGSLMDSLPSLPDYTPFEAMCIAAAAPAIRQAGINAAADDCVFIISSTKADIWTSPALSARHIASHFGNKVAPVVVSTACTSGVSAQVTAYRLLSLGYYTTAVIIGCDVQQEFIISGFQSFKALSDEPCRPFDAARKGLNAGEAAACLILQRTDAPAGQWTLLGGSLHNDANHISGPSRTAEGSYRCLTDMLRLLPAAQLSMVSVHGTGTLYNDEMEALALHRAGLDLTPVSALKGNYGHTMGAAGLLETILSMHALDRGIVLPSKGFETQGTTCAVNISPSARPASHHSFIKLLSGFGGINAAVAWTRDEFAPQPAPSPARYEVIAEERLSSADDLVAIYRAEVGDYPKFFKMDTLSRLGFIAVERLLRDHRDIISEEQTAVLLCNASSSLKNDTDYRATITDPDNYFPSPALFVYTLPNIVTGELAIRHHLFGETSFYVLSSEEEVRPLIKATFADRRATTAIVGWVECSAADCYEAHVQLLRLIP